MYRAFQTMMTLHRPDVVFVLGEYTHVLFATFSKDLLVSLSCNIQVMFSTKDNGAALQSLSII